MFKLNYGVTTIIALLLVVALAGCPPMTVTVPDVRNIRFSELQSMLQAVNLKLGDAAGTYSDTMEEYKVIGQDPAPETSAMSGTAVNVTVSIGPAPGSPVDDSLTAEQSALADATESADIDWSKVVLPDGALLGDIAKDSTSGGQSAPHPKASPQDVVADMLLRAWDLCDRTRWIYPDQGPNKPAQLIGLAYVSGGKHPELRVASADSCTDLLHGVDSSGFVYQCAKAAGIPIPTGPASLQGQVSTWNNALPAAWGLTMGTVLAGTPLQSGDIVCWGTHVGIIINDGVALYVAQSNGQPGECAQNQSITRGPRLVPYNVILGWFTQSPTFLRLTVQQVGSLAGWWSGTSDCNTGGSMAFFLDGNGTWFIPAGLPANSVVISSWSQSGTSVIMNASISYGYSEPGNSSSGSNTIEGHGTVNTDGSISGTWNDVGTRTINGVTTSSNLTCSFHVVHEKPVGVF